MSIAAIGQECVVIKEIRNIVGDIVIPLNYQTKIEDVKILYECTSDECGEDDCTCTEVIRKVSYYLKRPGDHRGVWVNRNFCQCKKLPINFKGEYKEFNTVQRKR